jgi:hypothetical protein
VAAAARGGPLEWEAVITSDREYFDRFEPEGVSFPTHAMTRCLAIEGSEVAIGRRSGSRASPPGIDLGDEPIDPGVSRVHARLVRGADGFYTLEDLDSTNGTTMNGDLTPIPPRTPVTITDGDRIHVGAWTTITIRLAPATVSRVREV